MSTQIIPANPAQLPVPLTDLRSTVERLRSGLQSAFTDNRRAPARFFFSRWALLPDLETESVWLCVALQTRRLHWTTLGALADKQLAAWLSQRDVVGCPVRPFTDPQFGTGYGIQIVKGQRVISKLAAPDLPALAEFRVHIGTRPAGHLILPLGVTGQGAQFYDLKLPAHLLIGGMTQLGKTAFEISALLSIMLFSGPDVVKVAIVDPKRQFGIFKATPHLHRVVNTLEDAIVLSADLINEADRRQAMFEAEPGADDFAGYNEATKAQGKAPLPWLVVVVDELLQLSLSDDFNRLKDNLIQLGSVGLSAGIRLIVSATNTDARTIDTRLRNQLAFRIAFPVKSGKASEAILGDGLTAAADLKMNPGRCLISQPASRDLVEAQALYVTSNEKANYVTRIATRWGSKAAAEEPRQWPVTDTDRLDYKIAVFCINEFGGFFETGRVVKQFQADYHLHNSEVKAIADRWAQAGWLGPSGNAKRGKLTELFVTKVATQMPI